LQVTINPSPKLDKTENLFVIVAQGDTKPALNLPTAIRTNITKVLSSKVFGGRLHETVSIVASGPSKITLYGIGPKKDLSQRLVRQAIFRIAGVSHRNRDRSIAVLLPYGLPKFSAADSVLWLADHLGQADYRFDKYITQKEENKGILIRCTVVAPKSVKASDATALSAKARILSNAVQTVRDMGNAPGNEMTPEEIGKRAMALGKTAGFSVKVFDKKQITKMKMGGLLAVNQGSEKEPRFIVMEHNPKGAKKTVCVVGKGITFDSGGISIKPSERMEEMKFDMCGAAAVLGILEASARLGIRHRVVGIVAATENLPSGSAYKPGDIITTMSGKTVEVVNTDAEGRMILSDALHYASGLKPDHLIDFATLTGACVIALGGEASGLFSNNDSLARKLVAAGEESGERLWRLPEWDEYKDYIRSEWADMKNSAGRWAGAITAAVFLKEFVDCPSWAHIDIAGTAWSESGSRIERKGASGVGVRATIRFLEGLE